MKKLFIKFVFLVIFSGADYVQAITFSSMTVTAIKDTSVVIQYDTDIAATGRIEYGLDTNYGSLTEVEGLSYWHPIEVTGLAPGTTYHYRIRAKDYKGVETVSGDFTLTTRTTAELEAVIRAARINGDLPKIYYVKNGGSNANNGFSLETAWATPYYAASRAGAGDIILVADGTYSGYVDFGWYVRPGETWGISEASITMKAYSGKPVIIGEIDIRADYITIDGFSTYGAGGHGIDVRNVRGLKILNTEVYNSGIDGIYFRDVTYSTIENAVVHNTGWNGIGIKPTSTFPAPGHHLWVRNSRAYDIMNHNAFDVQGDYMTFENCDANHSFLAPMGLLGDHDVVNNFTGKLGNNGIAVRGRLANSIILNSTLDAPIMRQGGVVSGTTFYNNYVTYSNFGILFATGNGNLIEENEIVSREVWGYTYGFEGTGNVTIRNEKVLQYSARSIEGATITVKYTDGRTFSVNGASEYNTYTWTGGIRTIKVVGGISIGNISGTVTDAGTGLGIEGATVSTSGKSNQTNSDGGYFLANIATGTQQVNADKQGYVAQAKSVNAIKDSTVTLDFTLSAVISPVITSYSPSNLTLSQDEGTTNTFSVTVDQQVTNEWFLDSIQQSETSQSYTMTWSYIDAGTHTITYLGENTNGSVTKTWTVTVNDVAQDTSQTDNQKIKVYPNPYIKGKSSAEKINFGNLPPEATIKIYKSNGELVKELTSGADNKAELNVSDIKSGIYLYVITSSEGTKKGKISVIK